jgi:ATP-dependent helicase YprA (DUF1998 family)
VCAPTGAGKTNIAMLAVLREVAANRVGGVIRRDAFKVRYNTHRHGGRMVQDRKRHMWEEHLVTDRE